MTLRIDIRFAGPGRPVNNLIFRYAFGTHQPLYLPAGTYKKERQIKGNRNIVRGERGVH